MPLSGTDACLRTARNVLLKEAASLQHLAEHLSPHFYEVCQQLCACQGKVIVMGMGKSGHVAQKIAATLASTGTPAFFVHPAEASHGDLGMIGTDDTVMMISQSGNTEELTRLLPYVKESKLPLILITNQAHSLLARHATLTLLMHAQEEACPLGLAPTTSSTNALALGDALAVACLMAKKFTSDAFAQLHPAGALGAQLHCQVADIMRHGKAMPQVVASTTVAHALIEMTQKHLGMTTVHDAQGRLIGIFTDGDLRRCLHQQCPIHTTPIMEVMNADFKTIDHQQSAVQALAMLHEHKITSLVVEAEQRIIGVIHMHDLLHHGITAPQQEHCL